jgi:hypothetical protein
LVVAPRLFEHAGHLVILGHLVHSTVRIEILLMNFPHRGLKLASLASTWVVGTQKCKNPLKREFISEPTMKPCRQSSPQFYLSPLYQFFIPLLSLHYAGTAGLGIHRYVISCPRCGHTQVSDILYNKNFRLGEPA